MWFGVWRVILVAAVVLLLMAAPVAAHGNAIDIDAQATADGTVHAELVSFVTDGYIVLHTNDDGTPGRVVGHSPLPDGTIHHDVSISINEDYWTNQTGTTELWAVLHREDGGAGFDPADDPPQENAEDEVVQVKFTVQNRSDGNIRVLAEREPIEETNTSTITVRHVALATDGFVVIRADDAGTPGQIVGNQFLEAGVHDSIKVAIDKDYFTKQTDRFTVWAIAHHDDGDESFSPADDSAIQIDDAPIQTQFDVMRMGGSAEHDHESEHTEEDNHDEITPTVTPPASPLPATTTSPPPQRTSTPPDPGTPTAPATSESLTPTQGSTPAPRRPHTTTTASTPGFSLITAFIAISLSILLARRQTH